MKIQIVKKATATNKVNRDVCTWFIDVPPEAPTKA
jgi:hypothetical protein